MSLLSAAETSASLGGEHTEGLGPASRPSFRAVTAAVLAGLATYAVLASHLVPGVLALSLLVSLLLAVPTAPGLARRIAINGALLIGWVPVLWWVRWPVVLDHGAAVLAGAAMALVLMLAPTPAKPRRWRRALPRVRAADLLVVATALLSLFALRRWAFPGSDHAALRLLVPSVDNVAHFHMFATIRVYGARTGALGPSPDGTPWDFNEYPQGFHSLAATVAELVHPNVTAGSALVSSYTESTAVVVALSITVLVAAVVSLPKLADHPVVALPVVAVTGAAFLWVPGQVVLADGFANFWVACAAGATSLLLAVSVKPGRATAQVAAIGGLQVAVAWAWAPLVALSAPAVLALLVPWRNADLLRNRKALIALGAAGLLVGWACLGLLRDVRVSSLVTATGGISGVSATPTMVMVLVGLVTLPVAPRLLRACSAGDVVMAQRLRLLSVPVVVGVTLTAVLLVAQEESSLGESSYYLLKFAMGLELVLAGVVPAACGALVASWMPSRSSGLRRMVVALVACVLAVLLSQSFGTMSGASSPLTDDTRAGTASLNPPYSSGRLSDGVIRALPGSDRSRAFHQDYLAIGGEGASYAFYADAWFHAITTTSSTGVASRMDLLRTRVEDVPAAVGPARRLLRADPDLEIIVSPRHLATLRASLHDPDLAGRVVTW